MSRRTAPAPPAADEDALVRRHLAFGWWAMAIFTLFGLLLEAAHGLKLGWYLDLGNATRRLLFTLGHAHGTLLGIVTINGDAWTAGNPSHGLQLDHAGGEDPQRRIGGEPAQLLEQ